MEKSKKGIHDQYAGTQKVGSNELSDVKNDKVSGAAWTTAPGSCYKVYGDDGKYVGTFRSLKEAKETQENMKSKNMYLGSPQNVRKYQQGGGINGK